MILWIAFGVAVVAMLALDLGVFHRRPHEIRFREALAWSIAWTGLAFLFMCVIYLWRTPEQSLEFLTGYLLEWSLSVDNIFVFLLIFSYFKVPAAQQHRVLFWGILGAVVMRALMVGAGILLIERFQWIVYVFGAFLIITGVRFAFQNEQEIHPEKNPAILLARRFLPVTERYHGRHFFVRDGGRWFATPLFLVLLVVETTDVIFAVDSVPAVLAITRDPFIVYTSNVFAILGLRSLYFAVAGVMDLFHYLKYGLAAILVFVGAKMVAAQWVHVPISVSLGVIGGVLVVAVVASLARPKRVETGGGS